MVLLPGFVIFSSFSELDLRDEGSSLLVHDRRELINTAEGRTVLGGDQVCADTPGVDGRALIL